MLFPILVYNLYPSVLPLTPYTRRTVKLQKRQVLNYTTLYGIIEQLSVQFIQN